MFHVLLCIMCCLSDPLCTVQWCYLFSLVLYIIIAEQPILQLNYLDTKTSHIEIIDLLFGHVVNVKRGMPNGMEQQIKAQR